MSNNTINTITIENISKYILEFKDGSLIVTPKMKMNEELLSKDESLSEELSEDELLKKDYGYSEVLRCEIKNSDGELISNKTKYMDILKDIWDLMTIEDIHNHSTHLYVGKTNNKRIYKELYYNSLSKTHIFQKVLKMIKHNSLTMNLQIEMKDKEVLDIVR